MKLGQTNQAISTDMGQTNQAMRTDTEQTNQAMSTDTFVSDKGAIIPLDMNIPEHLRVITTNYKESEIVCGGRELFPIVLSSIPDLTPTGYSRCIFSYSYYEANWRGQPSGDTCGLYTGATKDGYICYIAEKLRDRRHFGHPDVMGAMIMGAMSDVMGNI